MNPLLLLIVILILGQSGTKLWPGRHIRYIKGAPKPRRLSRPRPVPLLPQVRSTSGSNSSSPEKSIAPKAAPGFIDTFKMELLLDQLHAITNSLERVNKLTRMRAEPLSRENFLDRIQESLGAMKGFMRGNSKHIKKVDTLSNTLSGVQRLGNMESLISSMGPILSMLGDDDGEESRN